jgi:outer membrane protein assembly factor BamB/predicted phosphodiesterase
MKRILSGILFLLSNIAVFTQSYNYAWLTDIHIGSPGAEKDLSAVVYDINQKNNISFIVVTGDIAEKGKNEELDLAMDILDGLDKPYYIIAGNHDTKWSESGGTRFIENWGADRFIFEEKGHWHAGISSGIIWRGGGGHIEPEDIKWLSDTLRNIKPDKLFLYTHHPLNEDVDNWFKVINVIKEYNPVMIFAGHGHNNRTLNFAGVPGVMGRSTLAGKGTSGYTLVEVTGDSVFFSEVTSGKINTKWSSVPLIPAEIESVDSLQFINYSAADVIKKEFNKTVSAPLYAEDGRIFISTHKRGLICTDYKGNELWSYYPNGAIVSRPVFYNGVLVSATAEGDLYQVEAHTGKLIQVIGLGEAVTSQLELVDVSYNGQQTKGILAGTANGNMYCYDFYSLEMIWENNSAEGMIETKPLITDGKIIYGSWDGFLYNISAASGVLNWKWSENKNFYYSPAAVTPVSEGKYVYVTTPDKFVSAVDILLGTTVWRKNNFDAWETIQLSNDKEKLYIKSIEDYFYVAAAKDGKQLKKLEIMYGLDTTPSPPVETENKIYFGSKNGIIYSIDKETYKWEPLVFLGTSRIHSLLILGNNKLAAINMDGTLAIIGIE